MVHVALGSDWGQRIDLLLHLQHVQSGNTENLGFPALEDSRAVGSWNYSNLRVNYSNVLQASSVNTDTFLQNASAHNFLGYCLISR